MNIAGKKFGVYGLGRTGLSCIEFLLRHSCEVVAWDDNMDIIDKARAKFKVTYRPLASAWRSLDYIVLSPGVPFYPYNTSHEIVRIAMSYRIPIMSDIELLMMSRSDAKMICITGTNGKSTTTSLVGHIFEAAHQDYAVGGNIGIPVLNLNPSAHGYILELSSFQVDLLEKKGFSTGLTNNVSIDTAVLLNITPDHLDRYGNMNNYVASKHGIFSYTYKNKYKHAVVCIDDEYTRQIASELSNITVLKNVTTCSAYGNDNAQIVYKNDVIVDKIRNTEVELPHNNYLLGLHNAQNIVAAYAVSMLHGIPVEKFIHAIETFVGLPHRLQHIRTIEYNGRNIMFFNDSKATNAESCIPALRSFANADVYWLVGGIAKAGGITSIIKDSQLITPIKGVYAFGQSANAFHSTCEGVVNCIVMNSMFDAINSAYKDACENHNDRDAIILLSPACASYDQFVDYEDRGNKFIDTVAHIKDQK